MRLLRHQRVLLSIAFLFASLAGFCQADSVFKRSNLGIELTPSILPPGRNVHYEGELRLTTRLQSAYDLGINYHYHINRKLSISTGLHMVVGKRNFFMRIPGDNTRWIEDKELWGSIRIPLMLERNFVAKKNRIFSAKAGINLRYSGLMADESISGSMGWPGPSVTIFEAEFPAYKKPWLTYLVGAYRRLILRNRNILSIGLQFDYSPTWFVKGDYAITYPNYSPTYGTFKVSGTSLGLSAQYIFTGANKITVTGKGLPKKKRRSQERQVKAEKVLSDYVFRGNHIQFTFAPFTTFRARLRQQAGDHVVSTANAPGLLLSFKYQVNFNNNYSLITGPEAIFAGRNLSSFFDKNDFNPALMDDYHIRPWDMPVHDLIIGVPVIIEKRKLYAHKRYLFAGAGIRFNMSTGADFDGGSFYVMRVDSSIHEALGWDVVANNDLKPWISFPVQVGHGWLLKNNNLLSLSLAANISFTKYVDGDYYANIPGRPLTTGRYSSTGSFIGLALQYNFTNANYRLRRSYEKMKVR